MAKAAEPLLRCGDILSARSVFWRQKTGRPGRAFACWGGLMLRASAFHTKNARSFPLLDRTPFPSRAEVLPQFSAAQRHEKSAVELEPGKQRALPSSVLPAPEAGRIALRPNPLSPRSGKRILQLSRKRKRGRRIFRLSKPKAGRDYPTPQFSAVRSSKAFRLSRN